MNNSRKWQRIRVFDTSAENDALIWFKYWRPPIETLMNGSTDNYYAAMLLMYPCMERVYQLNSGRIGEKGLTGDVLKAFFPPEEGIDNKKYNELISKVANSMRHGLTHDAFVREEVELWDGVSLSFSSGISEDESQEDATIYAEINKAINPKVDGKVVVNVKRLWVSVKTTIDSYYTSRSYLLRYPMQDTFHQVSNEAFRDAVESLRKRGMLKENEE